MIGLTNCDEGLTLLYRSTRIALPMSGLHVGTDVNPNIVETSVNYSTWIQPLCSAFIPSRGFRTEVGIMSFSLELNDVSNQYGNLEFGFFKERLLQIFTRS